MLEPPPPYEAVCDDFAPPSAYTHRAITITSCAHTSILRPSGAALSREAERLKSLLQHCLAIDYGMKMPRTERVEHEDIEKFELLDERLRTFRWAEQGRSSPVKRLLKAYFTKNLLKPCEMLRVPVGYVTSTIRRYFKYTNCSGQYRGCVWGVLREEGLGRLLEKLVYDVRLLIPRVFADQNLLRVEMLRRSCIVGGMYFRDHTFISSTDVTSSFAPNTTFSSSSSSSSSSSPSSSSCHPPCWTHDLSIRPFTHFQFVATPRGREFEQYRKDKGRVGWGRVLLPQFWTGKAKEMHDRRRAWERAEEWSEGIGLTGRVG